MNKVTLIGSVSSDLKLCYDNKIEKYYTFKLSVKRKSGAVDVIPVILSEKLFNVKERYTNVVVKGTFRSYRYKNALKLYVLADLIIKVKHDNYNDVFLEGTVIKSPVHRYTPYNKEITDLLIKVKRDNGSSDYIPCICWNRTAKYSKNLKVGATIRVGGRFQSRSYIKNNKVMTAYEMSVYLLEVV